MSNEMKQYGEGHSSSHASSSSSSHSSPNNSTSSSNSLNPTQFTSSSSGGKRETVQYGSITLTKEEEAEFREIFRLVDRNNDNSISKSELSKLMATLGLDASEQELDLMVSEIDQNNDGEIQFEEFVTVMAKKVRMSYTSDDVIKAFKVFEPPKNDHPGYVDLTHLMNSLKIYSSDKLSPTQIESLLAQLSVYVDREKGGLLNYAEFVNMLINTEK